MKFTQFHRINGLKYSNKRFGTQNSSLNIKLRNSLQNFRTNFAIYLSVHRKHKDSRSNQTFDSRCSTESETSKINQFELSPIQQFGLELLKAVVMKMVRMSLLITGCRKSHMYGNCCSSSSHICVKLCHLDAILKKLMLISRENVKKITAARSKIEFELFAMLQRKGKILRVILNEDFFS